MQHMLRQKKRRSELDRFRRPYRAAADPPPPVAQGHKDSRGDLLLASGTPSTELQVFADCIVQHAHKRQ